MDLFKLGIWIRSMTSFLEYSGKGSTVRALVNLSISQFNCQDSHSKRFTRVQARALYSGRHIQTPRCWSGNPELSSRDLYHIPRRKSWLGQCSDCNVCLPSLSPENVTKFTQNHALPSDIVKSPERYYPSRVYQQSCNGRHHPNTL